MIFASHQPNFLPYMGFFYKMYMSDVFTLSDAVRFSNQGFHNYNFFNEAGNRKKITVPVSNKNGLIMDATLCDWEWDRKKLLKRLTGYYSTAPHFKNFIGEFEWVIMQDYEHLCDLNIALIDLIRGLLRIDAYLVLESTLDVQGETATDQIADIGKKVGCDTYLSGTGARAYLHEGMLTGSGIKLIWSGYKELEYGSPSYMSVFDYLMHVGPIIPDEWKEQKEVLRLGNL